jgi:acyl carrier protein
MPDDLTQRVIGCIADAQHLDRERIFPDSTFEELGVDSLDGINILFALENEFDVSIPDDAAQGIRSVRDMVDGIRRLVEEKAPSAGAAAPQETA